MNEQFFSLPEEKRNNIINAAMELFAKNDYKHAVTDDIAARAGISKGLLFYYFHNKKSLYLYLNDYARELITHEVLDAHFEEITDFFELLEYAAVKKTAVLIKNPYLMDFAIKSFYSQDTAIANDLAADRSKQLGDSFQKYFRNIDFSKFRSGVDPKQIYDMLVWMTDGYMHEKRSLGLPLNLDGIMEEFQNWVTMFRKMVYREEYL